MRVWAKVLPSILLMLFSFHAAADEITDRILDVDRAADSADVSLVLFESENRVLRLEPGAKTDLLLAEIEKVRANGHALRFVYDDQGNYDTIQSIDEVIPAESEIPIDSFENTPDPGLEPASLPSPTELFSYLKNKSLRKKAQCFHRAYLWSYDMQKEKDLPSRKVFVFFSKNFIRKHRFKWWFHVAPYVTRDNQNFVLDATYTEGPRSISGWIDDVTPVRLHCSTLTRFNGRQSLDPDVDCQLRLTNMYVYGTNHLARYDRRKSEPAGWMSWAVKQSVQAARP